MSENDIKYVNHCTQNRTQLWMAMAQGLLLCDFCSPGFLPLWTMLGCPFTETTPQAPVLKELTGLCVGTPAFLFGRPKVHYVFSHKMKDMFFIFTNNFIDLGILSMSAISCY